MTNTEKQAPSSSASPTDLYRGLMLEVKSRTSFVHLFLLERKQGQSSLPYRIAHELGVLQLRLTFECIALACACANLHRIRRRDLEKEWNAADMITQLDRIDPSIFPVAVVIQKDTVRDLTPQPITKPKFKSIYGRMGGSLHGRVLQNVISSKPTAPLGTWPKLVEQVSLDDVEEIHDTVVRWIQFHRIEIDGKTYLFSMIGPTGYPDLQKLDPL
jgi:hypothetical protein